MLFIAVTGPVACGKSTIARFFATQWPELVQTVQADNYYHDRSDVPEHERSESHINYDDPSAIDFDLLFQHLERLRSGLEVANAPSYDFKTHTRRLDQVLFPRKIVIVEGHQLVHGIPRSSFPWNLMVYVDTPLHVCFERRLVRDTNSRSKFDVAMQHFYRTLPAHNLYGVYQREQCDIVSEDIDLIKQTLILSALLVAGASP